MTTTPPRTHLDAPTDVMRVPPVHRPVPPTGPPPPPPRRGLPTWAVVVTSIGAGVAAVVLVFVTLAVSLAAVEGVGPTDAEVATACQDSLNALPTARSSGNSVTYDPATVTVTETSPGTYSVYGQVRLTVWADRSTATARYQCSGMTRGGNGMWDVADRTLSL